jgi:hypothetical protein|tara:strand:- start:2244 stop:2444 length:201 start_codon:yes stop_codon:yes gene_type:complete
MIDSDPWFLSAELEREGAGLDMTGPEGEELIIDNYFNRVPSPESRQSKWLCFKRCRRYSFSGAIGT